MVSWIPKYWINWALFVKLVYELLRFIWSKSWIKVNNKTAKYTSDRCTCSLRCNNLPYILQELVFLLSFPSCDTAGSCTLGE